MEMELLIVEDDIKTAMALSRGLRREGFDVKSARTGPEALSHLRDMRFDLVVLDWMLPGVDGLEVLRRARLASNSPKVIFLTARDSVEDRVIGLEAGADDYLVKPFAFAELLARIRVLLRQTKIGESDYVKEHEGLKLDLKTRRIWRDGEELHLTPREFELLSYFITQPNQAVTRSMLVRDVWREVNRFTPLDNVIDVHIAHLRKKIDRPNKPTMIQTIRGIGYMLR